MATELEEVENLIAQATFPGVKKILQQHLRGLKAALEAAETAAAEQIATSKPSTTSIAPVIAANNNLKYVPIESFAWEQGSYNSASVTVYVELEGVGSAKDRVSCTFGKYSFDLSVHNLNGKNYRLLKDNLEKDIVPGESKFIVKKDKVVIKLQKVKGEYSYESWNQLTSKKGRDPEKESEKKKDPMGGLMDMMKDMYDEGDENMKKIIGEAMLKSQRGEKMDHKLPPPSGMDDF